MKKGNTPHPGEVLMKVFLAPNAISAYRLAKDIGIPQTRISLLLKGRRGITADTALRLSAYFKNSAEYWLTLQLKYEVYMEQLANERQYKLIKPYQLN
jgi:addiction module HigA family antidote